MRLLSGAVGNGLRVCSPRGWIVANRRRYALAGYQIVTLDQVPDVLGDYPGEMQLITYEIGAEQVALSYRRMPQHTGGKGSYGHRHREQEEIYFVISGKLQFKLGDDVVEAVRGTAVRVAPEVVRSVWNDEPEDAELLIVSKRLDDPVGDTEQVPDFWP
jgi:quercetin dioxygenase-like cupin family protein